MRCLTLLLASALFCALFAAADNTFDLGVVEIDYFDSVDKSPVLVSNFTTEDFSADVLGFSVLQQSAAFSLPVPGAITLNSQQVTVQSNQDVNLATNIGQLSLSAPLGAVKFNSAQTLVSSTSGDVFISSDTGSFGLAASGTASVSSSGLSIESKNVINSVEWITTNSGSIQFESPTFSATGRTFLAGGDEFMQITVEDTHFHAAHRISVSGDEVSVGSDIGLLYFVSTQNSVNTRAQSLLMESNSDFYTNSYETTLFESINGNFEVGAGGDIYAYSYAPMFFTGSSITVNTNGIGTAFFSDSDISFVSVGNFLTSGLSDLTLLSQGSAHFHSQQQSYSGTSATWTADEQFSVISPAATQITGTNINLLPSRDAVTTANTIGISGNALTLNSARNIIFATNPVSFQQSSATLQTTSTTLNSGSDILFSTGSSINSAGTRTTYRAVASDSVSFSSSSAVSIASTSTTIKSGNLALDSTTSATFTTSSNQVYTILSDFALPTTVLTAPTVSIRWVDHTDWHTDQTASFSFNSNTFTNGIAFSANSPMISINAGSQFIASSTSIFNATSANTNQQLSFLSTGLFTLSTNNLLIRSNNQISTTASSSISITTTNNRIEADQSASFIGGAVSLTSATAVNIRASNSASFVATDSINWSTTLTVLQAIDEAKSTLTVSSQTLTSVTSNENIDLIAGQSLTSSTSGSTTFRGTSYAFLAAVNGNIQLNQNTLTVSATQSIDFTNTGLWFTFAGANGVSTSASTLDLGSLTFTQLLTPNSINVVANAVSGASLTVASGSDLVVNAATSVSLTSGDTNNSPTFTAHAGYDFEANLENSYSFVNPNNQQTFNFSPFRLSFNGSTSLSVSSNAISLSPSVSQIYSNYGGGISLSTNNFALTSTGSLSISAARNFVATSQLHGVFLASATSTFNGHSILATSHTANTTAFYSFNNLDISSGNQQDVLVYSTGLFSEISQANMIVSASSANPLTNSATLIQSNQGDSCLFANNDVNFAAEFGVTIAALNQNSLIDLQSQSTFSLSTTNGGIIARSEGFGLDPTNVLFVPYGILVRSAANLELFTVSDLNVNGRNINITAATINYVGTDSISFTTTNYEANVQLQTSSNGILTITSISDVIIEAGSSSFAAPLIINSTSTASLSSAQNLVIAQTGTSNSQRFGGLNILGLRGRISATAGSDITFGYSSGDSIYFNALNGGLTASGANVFIDSANAQVAVNSQTALTLSSGTTVSISANANGGSIVTTTARGGPISIQTSGTTQSIQFQAFNSFFNGTNGVAMSAGTTFTQNARCISMFSAGANSLISTAALSAVANGDISFNALQTFTIDSPVSVSVNPSAGATGLIRINAGGDPTNRGLLINSIGSILIGNSGATGTLSTSIQASVVNVNSGSQVTGTANSIFISAFGRNGAGGDLLLNAQQGPVSLNAGNKVTINSVSSTLLTSSSTTRLLASDAAGSISLSAFGTQNWISSIISATSKSVSLTGAQDNFNAITTISLTSTTDTSVSSASSLFVSTLSSSSPLSIVAAVTTLESSTAGSNSPITFDAEQSIINLTTPVFTAAAPTGTVTLSAPLGITITADQFTSKTTAGTYNVYGQPIFVGSTNAINIDSPLVSLSSAGAISLSAGATLTLSATNQITSTSDVAQTFNSANSLTLGSSTLSTLTATSNRNINFASTDINFNNAVTAGSSLTFSQVGVFGDRPNANGVILNTGTSNWVVTTATTNINSASSIQFTSLSLLATLSDQLQITAGSSLQIQSATGGLIQTQAGNVVLSTDRQLTFSGSLLSISSTGAVSFVAQQGGITWQSAAALAIESTTDSATFIANPTGSVVDGTITFSTTTLTTSSDQLSIRTADQIELQSASANLLADDLSIRSQLAATINAVDISLLTDTMTTTASQGTIRLSSSFFDTQSTTATLKASKSFSVQCDFQDILGTGTISLSSANQLFINSDLIISSSSATTSVLTMDSSQSITIGTFENFGSLTSSSQTGTSFQLTTNNLITSAGKSISTGFGVLSITGNMDVIAPNSITFKTQFSQVDITVQASALFNTISATADFNLQSLSAIALSTTGALSIASEGSLGQFDAEAISSVSRYNDDGIQFIADDGNLAMSANGNVFIRSVNGDIIFGARRAMNYNVEKIGFFGQTPSPKLTGYLTKFTNDPNDDYCLNASGLMQCPKLTASIISIAKALDAYGFIN